MITRFVPSCSGPGASDLDDAGSHATRSVPVVTTAAAAAASTSTPEDILRQAHATSLAGIFNQIEHSFEIFNELKDESARLDERFQRIQTRVSTIAQIVVAANDREQRDHLVATKLPTREECDAVLAIPEFSFSRTARHPALAEAYAKCEPMPALELFDEFCQPPQPATDKPGSLSPSSSSSSSSRKKYSNPGFFVGEWMKKETSRHQRVLQAKEERRRERRELKRGVKSLSLPQQQQKQQSETSNNNNSTPTGSENEPHKSHHHHSPSGSNKFLKIRSWREIYGTGEGKELARQQKQQQQKQYDGSVASLATGEVAAGGMLDGKKKSSRKSITAAAAACNDESAESPTLLPMLVAQSPPPPPSPLPPAYTDPEGDVRQPEQLHFSYVPSIYAPPPPLPPVSAACSGAFMQEIDDDDELYFDFADEPEMRVSTENNNNNNNTTPDSEEFVDHGLSYYYDPASTVHQLVPPPPPLPIDPVPNDENAPAFSDVPMDSDCLDEQDGFVPPPPPPPPPPPSSATESLSVVSDPGYANTPIPSRPPSYLLQEIQLGAPLRHIKIDEGEEGEEIEGDESVDGPGNSRPQTGRREPANLEAPASQLTLLEQIKMKQRNLRPVEPLAPRRPFQISKSAAPFADSIARILERRRVIAYDSDSSNSDASDNEW